MASSEQELYEIRNTTRIPPEPQVCAADNLNANKDNFDEELGSTENLKKSAIIDFDDLFPYMGAFGKYQQILFLMMIPYACFFAFVYFGQIFMTLVPEQHWCHVPELVNLTVEQRRHLSIPKNEKGQYDRCKVYDLNWTQILELGIENPEPTWKIKQCTTQWEYNFTDVPYETIATELHWVCENDSNAATAQSIFFCGAIVGGLIFGRVADKFGRIPALIASNLAGFAGGLATAFCNNFVQFNICRFITGLAYDTCFTVMYIIVLEYVGPKWRTFVANMSIGIFFTFAACVLPWIALAVHNWRSYALIIGAPLALAAFTPWVVPESVRWLISKGKIDEAVVLIQRCGRINKMKISERVMTEFRSSCEEKARNLDKTKSYSVYDLLKSPRLRRNFILLVLIWMAIAMVFDGHVRNVGSLGLDIFWTFTVATATEFPADLLLTLILDIIGRRWLSFGTMAFSGIFSLLATLVPIGLPTATLAIIGRFAVNISFNIGIQYATELLPTVIRGQGIAFIHIMGYFATILTPFIVYLANYAVEIPLIILGILGILGGFLCLFLPESTNMDMPETLQDGEEYGKDQKFWDIPCLKRKEN